MEDVRGLHYGSFYSGRYRDEDLASLMVNIMLATTAASHPNAKASLVDHSLTDQRGTVVVAIVSY